MKYLHGTNLCKNDNASHMCLCILLVCGVLRNVVVLPHSEPIQTNLSTIKCQLHTETKIGQNKINLQLFE